MIKGNVLLPGWIKKESEGETIKNKNSDGKEDFSVTYTKGTTYYVNSKLGKSTKTPPVFAPTGGDMIFETKHVMALLDFMPASNGHSLLVTKRKYATIMDMPPAIAAELLRELPRLARIVQKATDADGITILSPNGEISGQTQRQLAFHVIPWFKKLNHNTWGIKEDGTARVRIQH